MILTLQFLVALAFLLISIGGIIAGIAIRFRERPTFRELNEFCKNHREEMRERFMTREEFLRFESEVYVQHSDINEIKRLLKDLLE